MGLSKETFILTQEIIDEMEKLGVAESKLREMEEHSKGGFGEYLSGCLNKRPLTDYFGPRDFGLGEMSGHGNPISVFVELD